MKRFIETLVTLPVLLLLAVYRLRLVAFLTVSEALAPVPGLVGVFWRRRWYRATLAGCGRALYVDWMAAFRSPQASVGDNVFLGPFCWLGRVELGSDIMLGGHVRILSGAHHHNFDRLDIPMTQQFGELATVRIGSDVWVGNGAVIMADVAPGTVIGAGAVVTKTFEPRSIVAGVPARVIRKRGESGPPASAAAAQE
ncbi:MAG: acyltransferase [Verrucomicrobia bacterium]|nr:acyltransferase [Verrucomicrobiota bacterium]